MTERVELLQRLYESPYATERAEDMLTLDENEGKVIDE